MAKRIYFDEHIEYLREITPGRYNDEITKMFNKKFGMNATDSAIRTLRQKHKILSSVPRARRQYTDEQIEYLKKLSARGLFNREITGMFNEKFGTNRTENAIQNIRNKYGFKTKARHCWEKGSVPWNKGRKGISYPGMEATQFKKGNIPPNWVPIGSERVVKDGYVQIKIQDGKSQKNWKGKHIIIWEKHHGPVPKGHIIIFGDGDKHNLDPDNLICVSRVQQVRMNQKGLIKDNADLTRMGVLIADIHNKIGERRKEGKK